MNKSELSEYINNLKRLKSYDEQCLSLINTFVSDSRKQEVLFWYKAMCELGFLEAPASTRFHNCIPSGLVIHSLNVCKQALLLRVVLKSAIKFTTEESIVITALAHDCYKVGKEGQPLYIKSEPTERQKQFGFKPQYPYTFNVNVKPYLDGPHRSLYYALKYIPSLTEQEAQAIIAHDGQYVEQNKGYSAKEDPLLLLISYADNWSGFVIEPYETNN